MLLFNDILENFIVPNVMNGANQRISTGIILYVVGVPNKYYYTYEFDSSDDSCFFDEWLFNRHEYMKNGQIVSRYSDLPIIPESLSIGRDIFGNNYVECAVLGLDYRNGVSSRLLNGLKHIEPVLYQDTIKFIRDEGIEVM